MVQRVPVQQFSFTAGMLDSPVEARTDVRPYYAGARDLFNVVGLPQGGVETRPGMAWLDTLPIGWAESARLFPFVFAEDQEYLVVLAGLVCRIYYQGVKQAELVAPWAAGEIWRVSVTQALDTMILVHPNHPPKRLQRRGSHTAWAIDNVPLTNIPKMDFGTGTPEVVWSAARGWPRSVAFHEGRMYFGGSKSKPQTVWGSKAADYFNFNATTNMLDDEGVTFSLDGDRVNAVQGLYSMGPLFLFTSGGVFGATESPITPKNAFGKRLSEYPATEVPPVEIEGALSFIKKGSQPSLYEITYDNDRDGYIAQDLALLASSVMRGPKDIAVRLGTETTAANHVYVVNGRDGSLAVLNTRRIQQVTGWTHCQTAGKMLSVAVSGDAAYFVVLREIAGEARLFLEMFAPALRLDCAKLLTATEAQTEFSGLNHLEGERVSLLADNVPVGHATVAGGKVVSPRAAKKLEVGISWDWAVETMPLEVQIDGNTLTGERHRITKATLRLQAASALTVNGRYMEFREFPVRLDDVPPSFSGLKRVRLLGWSSGWRDHQGATVRITGQAEGPCRLLSITTEIAV